jgi:hypothetical protein
MQLEWTGPAERSLEVPKLGRRRAGHSTSVRYAWVLCSNSRVPGASWRAADIISLVLLTSWIDPSRCRRIRTVPRSSPDRPRAWQILGLGVHFVWCLRVALFCNMRTQGPKRRDTAGRRHSPCKTAYSVWSPCRLRVALCRGRFSVTSPILLVDVAALAFRGWIDRQCHSPLFPHPPSQAPKLTSAL